MKVFRIAYVMLALTALSFPVQAAGFHAADSNKDSRVSLSELLRVIQFFNSGTYGCQESSEDGYTCDAVNQTCTPHTSDYNPQDWRIDLSELLRVIQLFNAGGYYGPVISEDGFAPGKGGNPYLLPVTGDTDGDGLTDEEEGYLKMNPAVADEDGDNVPDGIGLALRLVREIAGLPQEYAWETWRYFSPGESRIGQDPFTQETITLCRGWLYNELSDNDTSYWEFAYGAMYFLNRGSFSFIPCDDTGNWLMGTVDRIPAHILYYLLYTSPEYLPDTHLVPVAGDSDGDYLSDAEEIAIGYAVDNPDENENGVPDGQDLARAMAEKVIQLPQCDLFKAPSGTAKGLFGCGKNAWIARLTQPSFKTGLVTTRCVNIIMWDCYFHDPVLGLRDDTDYEVITSEGSYAFSGLMLQIMSLDGTFNFYTCHFGCTTFRVDVPFLFDLLNMRGENQPPPASHLIPIPNDDDGDYLDNYEEAILGYNPQNSDENENGILDGIDLAHTYSAAVRALPRCDFSSKAADKHFFSCSKAGRGAQLDRIWNTPAKTAPEDSTVCAEVLEWDCMIDDPVLGISLADDEYRVHQCSGGQCYYEFAADALMLYIMEHEGSLGFYVEENGEWVYRRISVYTWNRVLNR